MEKMNEQEFDRLISEAVERQMLLSDINTRVMTEVRRSARRTLLRRWARVVAFAFGMPLLVFVVGVLSDREASPTPPALAASKPVAPGPPHDALGRDNSINNINTLSIMDCIMDLKQIVGIIMVFSVPLSLIIGLVYYLVDMKRNAFRLRSEIISGGVDCDTARLLLEETGRRHSLSFVTLRLGLLLFFTGIAAVLARVADFTILTLWLTAAIGGGVGLLIAFVIEWKMVEKK